MKQICYSGLMLIFLLLGFSKAQSQDIQVEGVVTSVEDGNALPGVNVVVKGTQIGTATNVDGFYSLTVPEGNNVLVFSFLGFETQEVEINGRNRIDVELQESVITGEEMVVTGYGLQRKTDFTGSTSSVESERLVTIPSQALEDALQGKVAGVQVIPVDGRPGSTPQVRIRGVGTLNDASPLFVVDGMLLDDISFLDTNDIESVEVLKDASATAIYGSRGANGVVVISTKKGRAGEPRISIRTSTGVQEISNEIEVANAREFATLANESAANEGRSPVFENPDQVGPGTDWIDFVSDNSAIIQDYQVSVSGGSEKSTYFVSTNYFQQDGVIGGATFQRVNLRVNNEYFATDNITIGHNIAFTFDDSQNEAGGLIGLALNADPTIPPRNEDGDFFDSTINGGTANPAASIEFNNNDQFGFRASGNAFVRINFLENFDFRSSFGLDWRRDEMKNFVPEFNVSSLQQNTENDLRVEDEKETNWTSETTLNFNNTYYDDHRIDVLGGITFQEFKNETLGGTRINLPGNSPEFFFLNSGETVGQTNFNSSFAWGVISFIGRLNYVYKDRYLLTGTIRRDGSSRFARANRWGNFPSIAGGWIVSAEPFFEDVPYVSFLKIRTSWGQIGNDKIATDAATPTVAGNIDAVFGEGEDINTGRTLTALANPDLRWEETEQYDVGVELNLFNDRFTSEVDWYHRATDDILVRVPIPASVGVQQEPIVNAAKVLNKGVDITLNWREQKRNFFYGVQFNGSTINNEVKSLGGGRDDIIAGNIRNLGNTTRTVVGGEIGAFYGWKMNGIFQTQEEIDSSPNRGVEQPGDIRIVDTNGDGTINEDDKVVLGSPIPDFVYGFSLSGGYKQFDVTMDFDGQIGNEIINARLAERGFRQLNYDAAFLDRWTGPGTSNSEPRVTESGHNFEVLDRFLEDGDFFRLRNVQLGYTVPVNSIGGVTFRNIRVFANATNVFTNSDFNGFNPQVGGGSVIATGIAGGNVFPLARSYTFGVEIDF